MEPHRVEDPGTREADLQRDTAVNAAVHAWFGVRYIDCVVLADQQQRVNDQTYERGKQLPIMLLLH